MTKIVKNTTCLCYAGDAEDAARFYAKTFPDSSVGAVHFAMGIVLADHAAEPERTPEESE